MKSSTANERREIFFIFFCCLWRNFAVIFHFHFAFVSRWMAHEWDVLQFVMLIELLCTCRGNWICCYPSTSDSLSLKILAMPLIITHLHLLLFPLQLQDGNKDATLIIRRIIARPDFHLNERGLSQSRPGAARREQCRWRHPLFTGSREQTSIRTAKVEKSFLSVINFLWLATSFQFIFFLHRFFSPSQYFSFPFPPQRRNFSFSFIETWVFTWSWWNAAHKPPTAWNEHFSLIDFNSLFFVTRGAPQKC